MLSSGSPTAVAVEDMGLFGTIGSKEDLSSPAALVLEIAVERSEDDDDDEDDEDLMDLVDLRIN